MYSLNLLDPTRRSFIHDQLLARTVVRTYVIVLVVLSLTGTAAYASHRQLLQRSDNLSAAIATKRIVSPTGNTIPILETTRRLNAAMKVLQPLVAAPPMVETVRMVGGAIPAGVRLTSLSISSTTNEISLQGQASHRDDVPELRSALTALPRLMEVTVESDLRLRTKIPVTVTAKLRPVNL